MEGPSYGTLCLGNLGTELLPWSPVLGGSLTVKGPKNRRVSCLGSRTTRDSPLLLKADGFDSGTRKELGTLISAGHPLWVSRSLSDRVTR